MIYRFVFILIMMVSCALGCVTTKSGITKNDEVTTRTTGNMAINPPMKGQNKVLVKIVNPTQIPCIDLCQDVKNGLDQKGYKVVEYLEQANYTVMGQIVQAGKTEPQLLKRAFTSNYGERLLLQDPRGDMLSKAVSKVFNQASTKSYILILDLKINSNLVSETKTARQRNRARIISGIQSTYSAENEVMPTIKDHVVHTLVSAF